MSTDLQTSAAGTDALDVRDMADLQAGRNEALDRLMERHQVRLLHYLIRSLQDEEDARDLAQETFVRVFQHASRYDPRQRFLTWLYAIASNLVRDRYRWRTRHPQTSLDAGLSADGGDGGLSLRDTLVSSDALPSDRLAGSERVGQIRQAIAALPEEWRQPLLLSEYEELSHEEIGRVLGCSAKAVELRIYRARKELKSLLGRFLEA